LRYGLVGQTDVVEFAPTDDVARARLERGGSGLAVVTTGAWRVTPIEYKRGRPKKDDSDRVQLCAQALCLEEMLAISIDAGALFYGKRRRRTEVRCDATLRATTLTAANRLHELIALRRTPPAVREPKCDNCSLLSICLPDVVPRGPLTAAWFDRALTMHLASAGPKTEV
jgi:CRISPR-associated exonuclease Cas4